MLRSPVDVFTGRQISTAKYMRAKTMTNENAVFRSVWVLSIFACFFALISVSSLVQKSPTYDEPLHLFAGYSYLKWGELPG